MSYVRGFVAVFASTIMLVVVLLSPLAFAQSDAAQNDRPQSSQDMQANAKQTSINPAPAFNASQLSSRPTTAWITNGGSLSNQRYSPLKQINRDNVANLKTEWRASLNGSGVSPRGSNQAEPLYYDGVVYIDNGRVIYKTSCLTYHGEDGRGGSHGGIALTASSTVGSTISTITNGRNQMPAFGALMSQEQL